MESATAACITRHVAIETSQIATVANQSVDSFIVGIGGLAATAICSRTVANQGMDSFIVGIGRLAATAICSRMESTSAAGIAILVATETSQGMESCTVGSRSIDQATIRR